MKYRCGAIPEGLLESGIVWAREGVVYRGDGRQAGAICGGLTGGTIFLDEINSASPAFQVKLLRVLQEKKLEPVGSTHTVSVDVRVVLASNQDLAALVKEGTFRQDLYYRVNVVNVVVPPLRERLGDITLLAESFLERIAKDAGRRVTGFSADAMDILRRHTWPGNVRKSWRMRLSGRWCCPSGRRLRRRICRRSYWSRLPRVR